MKRSILILILSLSFFSCSKMDREGHRCKYKTCPYLGKLSYVHAHTGLNDVPGDDVGSDCDIIDRLHWLSPEWTYDECEEAMMND